MKASSIADVVNLVLLLIALCLYAMLLWMVARDRRRPWRDRFRGGGDFLELTTAILGLVWNVGAFRLILPEMIGPATTGAGLFAAIAYSALGFLPAVFVDTALRPWGNRRPRGTWIPFAGYGLSTLAAVLHLYGALGPRQIPSPLALRILAGGFCALIPALLWVAPRAARIRRGLIAALALLAFAVCALHLSEHATSADTLSTAFFGHHASLPLILAILYEDYRFAFVDLFLKRAAALVLLSAAVSALYVTVLGPMLSRAAGDPGQGHVVGTLVVLWVATAFFFPLLRRAVDRFIDVVVLRRPDYRLLRREVQDEIAHLDSAPEVLDAACRMLKPALNAGVLEWTESKTIREFDSAPLEEGGCSTVLVPTTDFPQYAFGIGNLPSGRRLLSDDLTLLDTIAQLVGRRIDSLRLVHERYQRDLREEEILRLATEAELKALQAQLNPHFLFNALNTIGYLLRAAPERALATLLDLTHLLRAVLKRATGDSTTLGQEMDLVESYLAIERVRFEDRLRVTIECPKALRAYPMPPLMVQPLVENAIKHGIAPRVDGGEVRIVARLEDAEDPSLMIQVSDSGGGGSVSELAMGRRRGIGLANIEKRLQAYFGDKASLELACCPGSSTVATLRLPAAARWSMEGRKARSEAPAPGA